MSEASGLEGALNAGDAVFSGSEHDLRAVLRIKPFRKLWMVLGLSSLGDWMGLLATTALAKSLSDSYQEQSFAIGSVLIVRLLPVLLLGPVAGAFADRFDRRITMVVADIIRFGLFLSIPIVGQLTWLFVATFLIEGVSLFWIPAKEASVPNLVPPERLEAANQLSLITTYGSAPIAAGIFSLLSVLSRALGSGIPYFEGHEVNLALFLNAATFLVSAMTVATLSQISGVGHRQVGAERATLLRSIREGWEFVGKTPLVRGLIIGILGAFAAGGTVFALGQLYVDKLHGGDAAFGLLFGGTFLGLAIGMGLGPKLLDGVSRKRLFGLAISGAGISLSVLALLPNLIIALLVVLIIGGFGGVAWVIGYTLLGLEVDNAMRGRTFAFVQSLVRVVLLVVLAAAPFLSGAIGNHQIQLPNGAHIRADGTTVILFLGGIAALILGIVSFKQMDDKPHLSVWSDLTRSLRRKASRRLGGPELPGYFIALEGGEGSGKSTQVSLLAEAFESEGFEVVVTREPGGTKSGAAIRKLLLSPSSTLQPRTEALLYAADRAEHVESVIRPALERGAVVITDRYIDSSLAYQGAGRDLDVGDVARLSMWATSRLRPDLTVVLDIPPAIGLDRAKSRSRADRLEQETIDFHERVREGFLTLVERDPSRYAVIPADLPVDAVAGRILSAVMAAVPARTTAFRFSRSIHPTHGLEYDAELNELPTP